MIRKLLIALLSLTCVFGAAFGVAACNSPERKTNSGSGLHDKDKDDGGSGDNDHYVDPDPTLESNLAFTLNEDKKGYTVTGMGAEQTTDLYIPDTFLNTALHETELPVTAIADTAFANAAGNKITSLRIGANVTTIGEGAFTGCSALTALIVPDNVETLGTGVFANCTNLASVKLGSGIREISQNLFMNCTSLNSITFTTNKVTSIGANAFYNCIKLSDASVVGSSVASIGDNAFYRCSGLKTISLTSRNLRTIGQRAFYECTGLTDVEISGSQVREIGFACFQGCNRLERITIPFVGYQKYDTVQQFLNESSDGEYYVTKQFTDQSTGQGVGYVVTNFGFIFGAQTPSQNNTVQEAGRYIPLSLTDVKVTGGLVIAPSSFISCYNLQRVTITGVQFLGRTCFGYCRLDWLVLGTEVNEIRDDIIGSGSLGALYYRGTDASAWTGITIDTNSEYRNGTLLNATRYYYATSKPEQPGLVRYWHDVGGVPTPWN